MQQVRLVHRHHVWMVEAGQCLGFALGPGRRPGGRFSRQHLQGHPPPQRRLSGPIHRARPAPTDKTEFDKPRQVGRFLSRGGCPGLGEQGTGEGSRLGDGPQHPQRLGRGGRFAGRAFHRTVGNGPRQCQQSPIARRAIGQVPLGVLQGRSLQPARQQPLQGRLGQACGRPVSEGGAGSRRRGNARDGVGCGGPGRVGRSRVGHGRGGGGGHLSAIAPAARFLLAAGVARGPGLPGPHRG